MAAKSYTPGEKATAVALARMTSVDTAADMLTIDRRTLRGWVNAAPPAEDGDAWQAAEALAQQQLLTRLATGKITHPTLLATIAGIAGDKLWRRNRYAEREARKAEAESEIDPEQAAIHEATDALPPELRRWLITYVDTRQDLDLIREQAGVAVEPEQDDGRPLSEWLRWLAGTTPEQRQAMDDELAAEAAELMEGWRIIRTGRPDAYMHRILDAQGRDVALRGNYLDATFASLPVIDESPPRPAQDVTPAAVPPSSLPGPVVAVQRAPTPFVASVTPDDPLLDGTERYDREHPSWRRLE